MTTIRQRLDKIERSAVGAGPRRMVVVYPGQPDPEDIGPDDILLRIVYDDPLPTEGRDDDATTTPINN